MSEYDEVRYAIYNRLDDLSCTLRDEVIERISWLEELIRQRERTQIAEVLRGFWADENLREGFSHMADYLDALSLSEIHSREEKQYLERL